MLALPAGPADADTGLFTSLPLIWPEADNVSSIIGNPPTKHWALGALEQRGKVVALDRFDASDAKLRALSLIVMAQPRPLAPAESVALDSWVRRGGHLLLFADPLLTQHSTFALGDKRRPQDVVMLGPLLRHWGLALHFDPAQAAGERKVRALGLMLPVNLPGRFAKRGRRGPCLIRDKGVAAECRVGKGRALIIADAALFEPHQGDSAESAAVLQAVIERLLAPVKPGKTRLRR